MEFDWNVVDESELMMAQLLGTYQDQDQSVGIESMFQPHHGSSSSSDWLYNFASSLFSPIIETTSPNSFFFPANEFNVCELSDHNMIPNSSEPMNICLPVDCNDQFAVANSNSLEDYSVNPSESIALAEDTTLLKRKAVESGIGNEDEILKENPKKKVQKTTRKAQTKKGQKSVGNEEKEESNGSYSSEDNSNASQELNANGDDTITNAKGKTRAGRGSATDPQSLYARKRRERINERLRILQTLVPNGTKVDISTMLEEAVQYVKFLQLQIKLLSSDDMWMYAPLAYNGMDIGLDLKIPFPPQRH